MFHHKIPKSTKLIKWLFSLEKGDRSASEKPIKTLILNILNILNIPVKTISYIYPFALSFCIAYAFS